MQRSPNVDGRNGKEKIKYVTRHDKYYLIGGDLYVYIDGVMFKVHSYFFKREARNFFDDAPEDPPAAKAGVVDDRGTSEDRAIRLLDVTVQEFEQFLWVFYNPLYSIYDADISGWFSILKLAHRWDFPMVTEFAMRELKRREDEIPLVKRIKLYREYAAPPKYLVPLYAELCARATTPTEDEAFELGFEDTYNVFRAREALRSPGGLNPLPNGVTVPDTYHSISDVFGLPPYVDALDGSSKAEGTPILGNPSKKDKAKKK